MVLEQSASGLRVEADAIGEPGSRRRMVLSLTPRHEGWTANSLMLARVAFVVREMHPSYGHDQASIALVSVDRRQTAAPSR